ncbi:catalase-domain-containing protein [Jaminaea rosea]|uniref:Catalase n=1 Tax=Jaminaea rosea TaxID=1569628 RepID=A0A316UJA4_9BASI|nr:catalase-domain-containing protein [Jaminaea rosea]PWN25377.1 catalase-domain-containing protein [Jaminaea rosea]
MSQQHHLPIRSFTEDFYGNGGTYRASNGAPVAHPYESQRLGPKGPLLLQDFHLVDLLSHFDRERIPERVVHAKGGGAHGVYRTTHPIPHLSRAHIFAEKRECPVTVRFSTVGGESGSPDAARDPRGFSVKMRTEEGNMDWVFNNTPIFFLRDAAKFPHFIHTQKRDPQSHLTHGDDSTHFWEYVGQDPEAIHQMLYLFGDRGRPKTWRHMQGYSGHTFKFANADGWHYCQIHILSDQGVENFEDDDEADAASPDVHQKDLYEAINRGEYPTWTVKYQIMTPQQALEESVNVLDLTKTWPRAKYPLHELGKIELNQNVQNYFAEIEQVAFNPAHLVPGFEPSADPVLQSRLFSYPDTHRHRIGANYQQLPVNQNVVKDQFNFQRDGAMAFYNSGNRPNYLSSLDPPRTQKREVYLEKLAQHEGHEITYLSGIVDGDFDQAQALWNKVMDEAQRNRVKQRVAGHMKTCTDKGVLARAITVWHQVDAGLAQHLAKENGVTSYETDITKCSFLGSHNWTGGRTPASEYERQDDGVGNAVAATAKKGAHLAKAAASGMINGNGKATNGVNGNGVAH